MRTVSVWMQTMEGRMTADSREMPEAATVAACEPPGLTVSVCSER